MAFDLQMITQVYMRIKERVPRARAIVGRPLTYTEKILYSHLFKDINENSSLGNETYVDFVPDRVAMQDATGQMALLQFIQSGKNKTAVPSTVHCDHLIQANSGAYKDLQKSINENNEIFNFLQSVSTKYGIGFWLPGAGIIHQVILENYAFPGGMIIGTDSHTPNAGGLGMLAIGVGGADAVDVMAGMPWELKFPKLIGVLLKGELNGWSSPKDIILKVASILSVIGGTDAILEYFGEGAEKLSCTGKGTICNMGAEVGATTSIFGYDTASENYLKITGRADIADLASDIKEHLRADPQVYENPQKYFDRLITIDLSELEPHINGPFTPDLAWPISKFAQAVEENNWPKKLEVGLIGSCTNSSYEDISRSASIAKQAIEKNLKFKSKFTLTPGSEQVRYTLLRDGYLNFFEKIGALVLANACGPCIGQWKRDINDPSRKNSILTSFNRNFAKRNDGNANTHAFIASPEIVTAMALAGNLNFNPLTDTIQNEKGQHIKLIAPEGFELPPKGFSVENSGYRASVKDGKNIIISISPNSERLQLLKPFRAWDGENIMKARLLIKVKGKCTTDHISMAGPWLKYRGHLDNISNNLLIGAINAFNGKINLVKNLLNDIYGEVPTTARAYKAACIPTVIIGDENYGEGSSREHAAMEPRHLGIRVVLARSFARIHETNLKKQGIIALTFYDKDDYEKIQEEDWFNFTDLKYFAPNKLVSVELIHKDKRKDTIKACHSYNENQIEWVKAGSALNMIKMRDKKN